MKYSKIHWTTHTWNPVTGCTQVSPGCDNCYAKRIAEENRGPAFPNGFDLTLRPQRLQDPLKIKTPSFIFVNSMSDLFHKDIPQDYFLRIWDVMLKADWHIYQVLTKRAHRMWWTIKRLSLEPVPRHIWLGVSVENQEMARSRIPALLKIDAKVRFLSCEPLLEAIDLEECLKSGGIHWVIVGGESGPGYRPFNKDWARKIRTQCQLYGVPFFYKQGAGLYSGMDRYLDGQLWEEYPFLPAPRASQPSLL